MNCIKKDFIPSNKLLVVKGGSVQTIYKYMPLRDEFFDDPLFRITPPTALNDPFV